MTHRRHFLKASAATLSAAALSAGDKEKPAATDRPRTQPPRRSDKPKRRLAVVTTAYHYLSHAYHICGRFFDGYLRAGRMHFPDWHIAGMFVDQPKHPGELSREFAKEHDFTLYPEVAG